MLRSLTLSLILALAAQAQIWPDAWHGSTRSKSAPVPLSDSMLWAEYAGEAAESASYNGPIGKFTATAWRLRDSTSALAWFQASRPDNCISAQPGALSCVTPGAQWLAHQNYVLRFEGWRPLPPELAELFPKLPRLRSGGGLPPLPAYLPSKGRVRNSERYLMGVHSLQTFLPAFPPSIAGFEDGAEAQYAQLLVNGQPTPTAVFYYHTPQMARVKTTEFERQSGWIVHRSGLLVAVIPQSAHPDAARKILSSIQWKAIVVDNTPGSLPPMPDVAGMLLAIFELTGLLLASCIGGGLLFATFWIWLRRRRLARDGSYDSITVLQIRQYPLP